MKPKYVGEEVLPFLVPGTYWQIRRGCEATTHIDLACITYPMTGLRHVYIYCSEERLEDYLSIDSDSTDEWTPISKDQFICMRSIVATE